MPGAEPALAPHRCSSRWHREAAETEVGLERSWKLRKASVPGRGMGPGEDEGEEKEKIEANAGKEMGGEMSGFLRKRPERDGSSRSFIRGQRNSFRVAFLV